MRTPELTEQDYSLLDDPELFEMMREYVDEILGETPLNAEEFKDK